MKWKTCFPGFEKVTVTLANFFKNDFIVRRPSEGHTNVSDHFPKMFEDYRRFPRIKRIYDTTLQPMHSILDIILNFLYPVNSNCKRLYGFFTGYMGVNRLYIFLVSYFVCLGKRRSS